MRSTRKYSYLRHCVDSLRARGTVIHLCNDRISPRLSIRIISCSYLPHWQQTDKWHYVVFHKQSHTSFLSLYNCLAAPWNASKHPIGTAFLLQSTSDFTQISSNSPAGRARPTKVAFSVKLYQYAYKPLILIRLERRKTSMCIGRRLMKLGWGSSLNPVTHGQQDMSRCKTWGKTLVVREEVYFQGGAHLCIILIILCTCSPIARSSRHTKRLKENLNRNVKQTLHHIAYISCSISQSSPKE